MLLSLHPSRMGLSTVSLNSSIQNHSGKEFCIKIRTVTPPHCPLVKSKCIIKNGET